MCECIEKLEKRLTEEMQKQYPDYEVVESVTFQNTSFLFQKGVYVLNNPVLGRVKRGKQVRKFDTSMLPSYCPFCGEKINV